LFWVVATHGQARFLIPLLPNLACGLGVLAAWLIGEGESLAPMRRLSVVFACVMPLLASAATMRLFLVENNGYPNAALTVGISQFSGESLAARFDTLTLKQRTDIEGGASPTVYAAVTFAPGDKLFLLGDATPLYYLCPVVYNTTWDRSVLALAMEKFPDEPAAWTRAVQETGATYILINQSEIDRYRKTYGFDAAITPDRLQTWIMTLGLPAHQFSEFGSALYEVPVDSPSGAKRRTPKPAHPSPPAKTLPRNGA
jgi:hypothetical protein